MNISVQRLEQTINALLINQLMIEQDKTDRLRGIMKYKEPMSKYTSWRVGGPAERLYIPADLEDLSLFLSMLPETEELNWVGLGSNLLVRDKGIKGTVIATAGALNELTRTEERVLKAGAGVTCAKVARFAANSGLTGMEFLAGIPGTFGGALAMNAGAFGGETWDSVLNATLINRRGEMTTKKKDEFRAEYRSVELPKGQWFVSAEIELAIDTQKESHEKIRKLLAQRAESQPMGELSCGSVFRNPENDHAARLIEVCGLKGVQIGKASVSNKHANFIINDGGKSADDIEKLIHHVQKVVKDKSGIMLEPEVRVIGNSN